MTRIGTAASVAVVALALAGAALVATVIPATADKGGGKPFTYGDCVSWIAAGVGGQAAHPVTEGTAPNNPINNAFEHGQQRPPGLAGETGLGCVGLEPPSP